MPTDDVNRNALGELLKARRAELSPSDVGLPDFGGLCRVKGLRREEVAQLASMSADYNTRLEQGRIAASGPVLAAVSAALRSTRTSAPISASSPERRLRVPAGGPPRPSAHRCGASSTS